MIITHHPMSRNKSSPENCSDHRDVATTTKLVSGQFDDASEDETASYLNGFASSYIASGNHSFSPTERSATDRKATSLPRTTAQKSSPPPTETGVVSFTNKDVLFGRGGKTNNHNGNKEFRLLIDSHRQEYFASRKPRKTQISQSIVERICEGGGRFLKFDQKSEKWYDVGQQKSLEKTSQALREGAAQKLRDILSTKSPPSPNIPAALHGTARMHTEGILMPNLIASQYKDQHTKQAVGRSPCVTDDMANLSFSAQRNQTKRPKDGEYDGSKPNCFSSSKRHRRTPSM